MDTAATARVGPDHVLRSPVWLLVVRGAQVLISIAVLGLAGHLVSAIPVDEWGLAIATAVLTWVIVVYALVTELVTKAQPLYHIVAILCLDAFMLVLWLATWAANAAARARFYVYTGTSSLSSWKRAIVLYKTGADMMSAIAGLGALVWLLFIVSFVWTLVTFLRGRKEGRFPMALPSSQGNAGPINTQQQQAYQMEEDPKTPKPVGHQAAHPPTSSTYPHEQPTLYTSTGERWYAPPNPAPVVAQGAPPGGLSPSNQDKVQTQTHSNHDNANSYSNNDSYGNSTSNNNNNNGTSYS